MTHTLINTCSKGLLFALLSGGQLTAHAQSDKIEGFWMSQDKDARIQVYKGADGKFQGKIVWLREPAKNGVTKKDENNPKESLRNTPIVGLVILKGFKKDGDTYEDGTIYDPTNGKTYDCTMTYKGKELSIRGYVGISLLGRTTVWQRSQ